MITWLLLGAYLLVLVWLGVAGMRKTTTLASFAVGNRDMGPVLVGLVMASSIASTATFVINPGFVYTHGLSAFLHYAVAAQAGIALGLVAVCKGFRRVGDARRAVTVPDWIRARYGSEPLAVAFALLNLLSIAFVVLILFGCGLLLAALTGLGQTAALVTVLVVVFGYVTLGGAYAHAYTNAAQAVMMLAVAVVLFASGVHHLGDFSQSLSNVGPNYASAVNPQSNLYSDAFSVFVSGFVVTFALMLQPHILTKVLYLRSERDLRRFLITTILAGGVFSLCLFVGFYARFDGMDLPLADQDRVVTTYVVDSFGEVGSAVVLVALLAAGMSTLDGILVAVSAMVTHDLVLRGSGSFKQSRRGLQISRIVVILIGIVAFALAVDPPALVGIFAQKGVYGLAAASFVPIVFGVLLRGKLPVAPIAVASAAALVVHFSLTLSGAVANPAVCACYAIFASVMIALALYRRPRCHNRTTP